MWYQYVMLTKSSIQFHTSDTQQIVLLTYAVVAILVLNANEKMFFCDSTLEFSTFFLNQRKLQYCLYYSAVISGRLRAAGRLLSSFQ